MSLKIGWEVFLLVLREAEVKQAFDDAVERQWRGFRLETIVEVPRYAPVVFHFCTA